MLSEGASATDACVDAGTCATEACVTPLGSPVVPPAGSTSCEWSLGEAELQGDHQYIFSLAVCSEVTSPAVCADAAPVVIGTTVGLVPAVSIPPLAELKANPAKDLLLEMEAQPANEAVYEVQTDSGTTRIVEPGDASRLSYLWRMDPPELDLASSNDTKTLDAQRPLRVRANKLTPGGTYTFEGCASYNFSDGRTPSTACATKRVVMNRPPHGGVMTLGYSSWNATNSTRALSEVEVSFTGWVDDPEDMPLQTALGLVRRSEWDDAAARCGDDCSVATLAENTVSWVAENSMSKGISFFPSEGEWYVLGFVSDRRDAWTMARAELLVHPEALSAERVDDVKARLRVMQGERDGDGFSALAKQLATAALAGEAESSEGDAALLSELTAQMSANVCGESASSSGPWVGQPGAIINLHSMISTAAAAAALSVLTSQQGVDSANDTLSGAGAIRCLAQAIQPSDETATEVVERGALQAIGAAYRANFDILQ